MIVYCLSEQDCITTINAHMAAIDSELEKLIEAKKNGKFYIEAMKQTVDKVKQHAARVVDLDILIEKSECDFNFEASASKWVKSVLSALEKGIAEEEIKLLETSEKLAKAP